MLCDACSTSMANASNRRVNRLCFSAHGTAIVFTPHVVHIHAGNPCRQNGLKRHRIERTPAPLRRMILHRTRGPTLGTHNVVTNELQRQSQRLVPHVQLNIRDHPVLIQTNQLMVMPRQRVRRNASEKPHFRYFQISVNSTGSHKNPRRTFFRGSADPSGGHTSKPAEAFQCSPTADASPAN